jgi:hypothetical protein
MDSLLRHKKANEIAGHAYYICIIRIPIKCLHWGWSTCCIFRQGGSIMIHNYSVFFACTWRHYESLGAIMVDLKLLLSHLQRISWVNLTFSGLFWKHVTVGLLWIVYGLWLNTTRNEEYEFYSCHVYFENQPICRGLQKSNNSLPSNTSGRKDCVRKWPIAPS